MERFQMESALFHQRSIFLCDRSYSGQLTKYQIFSHFRNYWRLPHHAIAREHIIEIQKPNTCNKIRQHPKLKFQVSTGNKIT